MVLVKARGPDCCLGPPRSEYSEHWQYAETKAKAVKPARVTPISPVPNDSSTSKVLDEAGPIDR
jgi:hypothetical protein